MEKEILILLKKIDARLEGIEATIEKTAEPEITKESIMAIQDRTERQKAIQENIHLFA